MKILIKILALIFTQPCFTDKFCVEAAGTKIDMNIQELVYDK